MKSYKKIIGIISVIVLISGICVFTIVSQDANNPYENNALISDEEMAKMSSEKRTFAEKYNEKVRKAIEVSKNYQDSDRPVLDEKALKEESQDFRETGVQKAYTMLFPMSSAESQAVIFDTCASLRHNLVATGKSKDNLSNGIIYNFYYKASDGLQTRYVYVIPGEGNVTLTGVDKDKNTFTFKTQSGKAGVFDVSDGKGVYQVW